MFNIPKYSFSTSSVPDGFAQIPYKLSGSDILHAQGYKGKGIKVAILDTGADYNHELLMNRINEISNTAFGKSCIDEEGHGTHVAGTYAILAPECEIVPYKVIAPYGGEWQWLIDALNKVADRDGIDVINMSLSGEFSISELALLPKLEDAIKRCYDKNIFMVVASGNTGKEQILYPAGFDEVTTVGAVNVLKGVAAFSTSSSFVDVCQVGVSLTSSWIGGGYRAISGTSMATPMVGGIVALLAGKYKEMFGSRISGKELFRMLKLYSIDLGIKGLDKNTGAGFITLNPGAKIIKFTQDSKAYTVNSIEKQMDVAVVNIEGRLRAPLRFANDGALIIWNGDTREATFVG